MCGSAIKLVRRHREDLDGALFLGWHNREFSLVPPEERRRLYVFTLASWNEFKPCLALSVRPSPVLEYEANAMVDVDDKGRVGVNRDVFLRVAIANHCVVVTMQFLKQIWPWASERLKSMPVIRSADDR